MFLRCGVSLPSESMTYLRISLELLQGTRRATLLVVAHAARRDVRSTWNQTPRR